MSLLDLAPLDEKQNTNESERDEQCIQDIYTQISSSCYLWTITFTSSYIQAACLERLTEAPAGLCSTSGSWWERTENNSLDMEENYSILSISNFSAFILAQMCVGTEAKKMNPFLLALY